MYNFPYLKDTNFLKELDCSRIKEQFLKIIILNWDETPIQDITGYALDGGSINLDGSSAMRRTANIQLFANNTENDLTNVDNLISINKKVELLVGLKNFSNQYKEYPILWFPQGIFVIISANVVNDLNGKKISLTLHDKMALLNGECGGVLPASVIFHEVEEEDEFGNITVSKPSIQQIIREILNHWGNEQQQKIIINNLDDKVKQVLRWNKQTPLFVYSNSKKPTASLLESEVYYKALENAYKNFVKQNKEKNYPSWNNFIQKFNAELPKITEITNNQKMTQSLLNIATISKEQLNNFKDEESEMESLLSTLKERKRSTATEIVQILKELSNDLQKFFTIAWEKPYTTNIQNNEKYINFLTNQINNYENYVNVYKKSSTLKTNLTKAKSLINSKVTRTWKSNNAWKVNREVSVSLAMVFNFMFAQKNETFYCLNNTNLRPLHNFSSNKTLMSQLQTKLKSKNLSKKDKQNYLQWKAALIRANNNQDTLYIINGSLNKTFIYQINSHTKCILLSVNGDYTNLIDLNAILLNNINKNNEVDTPYYCFSELTDFIDNINLSKTTVQKQIKNTLLEGVKSLFNQNIIAEQKTQLIKTCLDNMITICDNILTAAQSALSSYNNIITIWGDIRTQAFTQESQYSTIKSTFDTMLNTKLTQLQTLIYTLPRENEDHTAKMREPAIQQFEELKQDLLSIKSTINNLNLNKIDILTFYTQIETILNPKKSTSYPYIITKSKDKYINFFSQKKFAPSQDTRKLNTQLDINIKKIQNFNKKLNTISAKLKEKIWSILFFWKTQNLSNQEKIIQQKEKILSASYLQEEIKLQDVITTSIEQINQYLIKIQKASSLQGLEKHLESIHSSVVRSYVKQLQQIVENFPMYSYSEELADLEDIYLKYEKEQFKDLSNSEVIQILSQIIDKYQQILADLSAKEDKILTAAIKEIQTNSNRFLQPFAIAYYQISNNNVNKKAITKKLLLPYKEISIWDNFLAYFTSETQKITSYQYGENIGYALTDFNYPGTLIANAGDTIVSILDKIKGTLGNYEYFYDINGNFIFQEIKNYLNTSYSTTVLTNNLSPIYDFNTSSGKSIYDFTNSNIIQSYTNNLQYQQIKNDFIVWGERSSVNGSKLPIRYHLAIDTKPAVGTIYFWDAPPENFSEQKYKYKSDFPTKGDAHLIYYASYENKFYKWFEENESDFSGYQLISNQIINNKKCKVYKSEEDFPNPPQSNNYLFYSKTTDLLYKYDTSEKTYKETWSYRLKKCKKDRYKTIKQFYIEGQYYTYEEDNYSTIYQYKNNKLVRTPFIPKQAVDYRTQLFLEGVFNEINGLSVNDYYTELKNEWPKIYDLNNSKFYSQTINNPSGLDFFLDLLSSSFVTNQFSIAKIGKRTQIISNDKINCIFEPNCPENIFINLNPPLNTNTSLENQNIEQLNNEQINEQIKTLFNSWKKNNKLNSTALLFELDNSIYQYIVIGGIMRSAYEEIRSALFQYINYSNQVSITTLPIYYLQPNSRITINDKLTGIYGDYMIKNLSIPLGIQSTMNINCTKALEKI